MTKTKFANCLAVIGLMGLITGATAWGEHDTEVALKKIEPRLRGIYQEGAFGVKRFRGKWLPDSSGYTVMERTPGEDRPDRVRYDVVSGERTVLERSRSEDTGRERGVRSPDGKRVVYSAKGNLHVRDLGSDQSSALTKDQQGIPVTKDQARWSPDGTRIVFVQTDHSEVRLRPVLVPGDPSYPKVSEHRFARVGGTIPDLKIGIIDVNEGETRWVKLDSPEEGFYLGIVEWAGNSEELLIEKLSRFRDQREFLLADVRTGEVSAIFRESDPAWVVASINKNGGLEWIRDGEAFVVISEKDAWRHAYVYGRDGEEQALLTPGDYDIIEKVRIDEAGGWFYFNASPKNGTQKYLFRVRLDGGGKLERVTPEDQPGTHHYDFSPDSRWAFHTYSTYDTPPLTDLVELPGHRVVRVLEDNAKLRRKAKELIKQPTEFCSLEIGNGVEMDAWMIKPFNFDPSRKYPVLVYVYGEPHAQTVKDAWGTAQADYHRAIADLGYLVVSIDNRGTPAPKGAAWRRAVAGSLGPLSTEEQAAGLRELARTRPFIDLDRVGIWGWSGGGSNTLNAMFRKPELYHVGIAVVPKPQPQFYNAWFQEIYMETPETNPEGYRKAAAINYAEGLKGKLLIVHGSGETNTHLEIVEGLVDRLIAMGKPFDFMVYPNRNHGISEGAGTTVHHRMLMARYLLTHLAPGPR